MDWRHEAACREVDPELFFPIGNSGPALLQIEEARQVCHRCSVMDECLRWAIDSGQDAGVWGGRRFSSASRPCNRPTSCESLPICCRRCCCALPPLVRRKSCCRAASKAANDDRAWAI